MESIKRKILLNISFRAIFVFISKLMSLLFVPLLARYLGPQKFGEYNYLITVITYCAIAVNFGFLSYGIRSVSEGNSLNVVNTIFTSRALIGLFSILATMIASLFISFLNEYLIIIIITIAAESLFLDFYFYGKKNVLIPSLAHVLSQLFYFGCLFLLVHLKQSMKIIILFYSFSRFLESMLLFMIYTLRHNKIYVNINKQDFIVVLKKIFLLGFGNKIAFFKSSIPTLIIPSIISFEALGYYSGFMKFAMFFNAAVQIILFPIGPFISENKKHPRFKVYIVRFILGLFLLGIIISVLSIIFKHDVVNTLLGSKFEGINEIFNIGTITILLLTPIYLGTIVVTNYTGADKTFFKVSLISFIMALLLTPIFTFWWGLNGAFIANFLSTLYFVAVQLVKFLKKQ